MPKQRRRLLASIGRITRGGIAVGATVYALGEAFAGLGRAGLITVTIVSIVAIVTFIWIFRETKRRD